MTVSIAAAGVLVAAGAAAGALGSAGGITSLVSYPALLAVGLPALAANVANLVALVACWPGSALTSRRELAGTSPWLVRLVAVAALGGAAGAVLLVTTPSAVFTRVVPFLVVAGSLSLVTAPRLTTVRAGAPGGRAWLPAAAPVGLLAVYGGYFGAGSGVMLLACTLVLLDARLPQANAVKNMLVGASVLTAAAVLVLTVPVRWSAVVPLAVGLFLGSLFGPVIARRVPAGVVRWVVGGLGLVLAGDLWWEQWHPH